MGKLRSSLCLLCLLLLAPLLVCAWRILPLDTRPLVEKKYAGWSGVLRLWAFEGWSSGSGSLSPWLNQCIARFEKAHPGVYLQPQFVDADAIADFNDSGILPPDLLLFPPGLLASPEGLVSIDAPDGLRPALARCGLWDGAVYAAPVALGGYVWALNRALSDALPLDWNQSGAIPAVSEPEDWRHWGAALLALSAGRQSAPTEGEADVGGLELQGLDLGLNPAESPKPSPTPAATGPVQSTRLPSDFAYSDSAWRDFINGEAAAMPVTQREIRRLQALSDQGKGPDWQLYPGDAAFSDQLALLGIVEKENAEAQRALCREFLSCLLEPQCQSELYRAGAFSVTDALSGYPAGDPLSTMEASLRSQSLATPNGFDAQWRRDADYIVRKFIDAAGESTELWRQLRDRLANNPNIS